MKFCEDCGKIFGVRNYFVVLVDTPVAGQHDPPTKSLDYSWVSVAFQPVKMYRKLFWDRNDLVTNDYKSG